MKDERGTMSKPPLSGVLRLVIYRSSFFFLTSLCLCASVALPLQAQIETVEGGLQETVTWINHGQVEGHLALAYSPAGAFSPDSASLAVAVENRVVIEDLRGGSPKPLKPRVVGVTDLVIHSASYLAPHQILLLANGIIPGKGKNPPRATPTMAIKWDTEKDALIGTVNALGESGGYGTPRYFPMIGYIGMYKDSNFDLWHPLTGKFGRIDVPSLTHQPNLYDFSPDGHWLILAQIENSAGADPSVVDIRTRAFVESLSGQQSTTLNIAFSRSNQRVLTACEDGKVRVWSVGNWKLVATLSGHHGTVSWAEFSPDGNWIASGGYDKTVRIWSASDGTLQQTLTEPTEPVRTVAFSPNGEFVVASGEEKVWYWKRTRR